MEKEITPINKLSWSDKLKSYTKHPGSFVLLLLVSISAVLTVTVLGRIWTVFRSDIS